nr:hemerythrin domain-containing protein [Nitrospirota bacterium]
MSHPTIHQFFQKDHERLDTLFKNFHALKRSDFAKAKEAFVQFKFGLQRHIVWEEDILFPLWERQTGMAEVGPTMVMRAEHRQIGDYLETIHRKVQQQDPESDQEEQRLLAILSSHNQKEERILYHAIDSILKEEDRASIYQAMNNIPEERYKTCCGLH